MSITPGTRIGPYEIVSPLGAGGMGEVYRARDERLARDVALKVLPVSFAADPDRLRRFEQEARATGQLNHPNILVVYDTGTHDGAPYVVAELLEGETLRQKLTGTPLPLRKTIDYGTQIAHGLAAAHQKGVVHRDLKPENLFVTTDGRLKILDFGLAKLLVNSPEAPTMTEAPTQARTGAGVVVGTAGYMSPEQVRGQPTDQRSDIFSFGSILYEMATGHRAFHAGSSVETMNAVLKEDPPEISRTNPAMPAALDRIVQHCLEKSPDERFQSARDLAFQIEALSTQSTTATLAAPAASSASRSLRTRPVVAAVLLALMFAAGWFASRLTRTGPAEANYERLTFRKGTIATAQFGPDGETVVYSAAWDGRAPELFSTRAGSPESRSLGITPADIAAISPAGEMALLLNSRYTVGFQRSGTLARAPLAGGVPRELLEDVQDADWAPQGDGLAVARSVEGRYRLEYPIGKVLYETDKWISGTRFSRDGKRIAFFDHPLPGDNRGRVAVADLSGKVTFLTEQFSSTGSLDWSASGDEVWFSAGKTGNVGSLYGVNLAGRQRMVDGAPASLLLHDVSATGKVLISSDDGRRGIMSLPPGETVERDLSWLDWSRPSDLSASGEWLLFEEQGQGGGTRYSVHVRKTDGSQALKLGDGYSWALSPDGRQIVSSQLDEIDKLYIIPRGAGETRSLEVPLSILGVRFFPDGKRLLIDGSESGHRPRIYVVGLEGGAPRPITPEGTDLDFALSTDGRLVAASVEGAQPQLFPVDGGAPRAITGLGPGESVQGFTNDGAALFVAHPGEIPLKIQRLDLATGVKTTWKELVPADRAGLSSVDFFIPSADGRSYVYSYRRFLSTLYVAEDLK